MKAIKQLLIASITALPVLCICTAQAASPELTVSRDMETKTISIDCTVPADDLVALQILPESISPEQIENDPGLAENVVYCANRTADSAGKVVFTIENMPTGSYVVYAASAQTDEITVNKLSFNDIESYKTIINLLKASSNEEDFLAAARLNKSALGFDINIYSDNAVRLYYKLYSRELSETDYEKNVVDFTKCALMAALNGGLDVDATGYIKRLYPSETELAAYIDKHTKTTAAQSFFTALMCGKNIQSEAALIKAAKEAVVLTAVKYPDGYMNIKAVMEAYKDVLGLSTISTKSSVYSSLSGKEYTTVSALVAAYKGYVSSAESSSGGGGGGGGGGGSTPLGTNSGKYTSNSGYSGITMPSAVDNTEAAVLSIKFEDLDSVLWAYQDISELYELGIVSGYTETEFKPNNNITREEFVKLLICAMGYENDTAQPAGFTDVPAGSWYEEYVNIAARYGIVSGTSETTFGSGGNITRQDMAVMIYNAVINNGFEPSGAENAYADKEDCADYANEAIAELSAVGIINGIGDDMFAPRGTATRAQAAVIINRALDLLR